MSSTLKTGAASSEVSKNTYPPLPEMKYFYDHGTRFCSSSRLYLLAKKSEKINLWNEVFFTLVLGLRCIFCRASQPIAQRSSSKLPPQRGAVSVLPFTQGELYIAASELAELLIYITEQ